MLWQVFIPLETKNDSEDSLTVDADSWFSALQTGLDQRGLPQNSISSLSCIINPDKSFKVTDKISNAVYKLKLLNGETTNMAANQSQSDASTTAPINNVQEHNIFYSKDEISDDGSGIYFRERLIAVPPGTPEDEAGRLVMEYYQQLKDDPSSKEHKLFISVQLYDHEFEEQSEKPAIAALTWKEWTRKKPKILFPLSGSSGLTLSKIPAAPMAKVNPAPQPQVTETVLEAGTPDNSTEESRAGSQQAKDASGTGLLEESPIELKTEAKEPKSEPVKQERPSRPIELVAKAEKATEKKAKPEKAKPKSLKKKSKATKHVEDKMVTAFERMHDIFEVRTHDTAAAFALKLARELIDCEAGSCMLISPGKYELYVSAAEGPTAKAIKGNKLSLTKGIIGSATRAGVTINVPDAASDPRFNDEFDKKTRFTTKNVICAPVQHDGRTRGALELVNSTSEGGFTAEDIDVVTYVGGALAEYIDNSLPSRQADFTDKDFSEWLPTGEAKKTGKKKVAKKSPAKSKAKAGASKSKIANKKSPAAKTATKKKKRR